VTASLSLNGIAAGTYSIDATYNPATLNASFNTSSTASPATLTLNTNSQTITFGALSSKTYGDTDFGLSASASSGLPVSFASLTSSVCTVSSGTVHIVTSGTCTIRATQPGDGTYSAAPAVDRGFTVAKAALTVTANNQTRAYGAANPTFTASY